MPLSLQTMGGFRAVTTLPADASTYGPRVLYEGEVWQFTNGEWVILGNYLTEDDGDYILTDSGDFIGVDVDCNILVDDNGNILVDDNGLILRSV